MSDQAHLRHLISLPRHGPDASRSEHAAYTTAASTPEHARLPTLSDAGAGADADAGAQRRRRDGWCSEAAWAGVSLGRSAAAGRSRLKAAALVAGSHAQRPEGEVEAGGGPRLPARGVGPAGPQGRFGGWELGRPRKAASQRAAAGVLGPAASRSFPPSPRASGRPRGSGARGG